MKSKVCAVAMVVAIVAGFAVRANALSVSAGESYPVGTEPVVIATGDLNKDGVQDVVTFNNGSSDASVLLGSGDGGFVHASTPTVVVQPVAGAIADVNGDARPDLISVGSANGNIVLRLGDGTGAFPTSTKFKTSSARHTAVAAGDVNGDGKSDIVSDAPRGSVMVLLGRGSGGFVEASGSPFAARQAPSVLAVADMTGDRYADVVVASASGGTVSVLRGSASGALTLTAERILDGRPSSIAVADVDGDGANDVVAAEPAAGEIAVLRGDGSGNLNDGPVLGAPMGTRGVAIGDMNGDEVPDVVGVSDTEGTLAVELGDGAGGFVGATGSPFTVPGGPNAVAVVAADAVLARSASNDVVVERNTSSREPSVSPSSVDFGNQETGTTSDERSVTASSDGLVSTITSVATDGDFAVTEDGCSGRRIGDGYPPCDVSVEFSPSDTGARSADLTFTYNDGSQIAVPLSGTGVDLVPPDTTITSGPSGLTDDPSPSFTFESDDPTAHFECRADADAFTLCGSPYSAAFEDGAHTFVVRAVDPSGNADPSPARLSFTVDTTAPDTTIIDHPASETSDDQPAFSFAATESDAAFDCSMDGADFAPCDSPFVSSPLDPGAHTFAVRACDEAGNADPTPATFTFTVSTPDDQAPETTITEHPDELTNDTTPTFRFISDEGGATFTCAVDDGEFSACGSPYTTDVLGEGRHVFRVAAVDAAGNVDPSPDTFTLTIDVTSPRTTIVGPSRTKLRQAKYVFRFTEDVAHIWCSVDGSGYSSCATPFNARAYRSGSHVLRVRAVDAAGNTEASPAVKRFTIVRRK